MAISRALHGGPAVATALTIATVVGLSVSCAPKHKETPRADYCVIMPDSIGLYAGNPVTQMGYQIGKVTNVIPQMTDVRVDFTVTEQRSLPSDVRAIIRSTSILADRSLELVGNADAGPHLRPGECISLARSSTPKSLSQVIGSATNFVNRLNPSGSKNIGDVVHGVDQAIHSNGANINQLLSTSSSVLDSPDQAITDIGTIMTNLAELTSIITDIRAPLKEVLVNAKDNTMDLAGAVEGGSRVLGGMAPLIAAAGDIETNLGDNELQFTLDSTSMALRKLSAHAPRLTNLLNPLPWWINTLANHYNNREFHITYRPPLYRIRTPNGLALCGMMNASMPGSCADVAGQPFAVDVALLQYVLTQANR